MLLVFDRAYYYSKIRLVIAIVTKLWEIRFYSTEKTFSWELRKIRARPTLAQNANDSCCGNVGRDDSLL